MRWLYHLATGDLQGDSYAPTSLATEGFVHASYRDRVAESGALYFAGQSDVCVLCIDPRRLDVRVEVATTPRGPMPHIHGPIPRDAIRDVVPLANFGDQPDLVTGTRFAIVSFPGLTLLDLVGVYDPIARIAAMGFDASSSVTIVGAASHEDWQADGAALRVSRVRPDLCEFDVLVVPGGPGARALASDETIVRWLASFPVNRLAVSVCTGSLLLGAAGRLAGRRATTHPSMMSELAHYGATPCDERVVDEGQLITGGGVTCAIDVGLHVVRRLAGDHAAESIAAQMVHNART